MPEAQEALKEDNMMVDLDTSGKAVDVELKDPKADTKEVETKDAGEITNREVQGIGRMIYGTGLRA